jgi:hypothetical protein
VKSSTVKDSLKKLNEFAIFCALEAQQKIYGLVYELRGTEPLFLLKQSKF